jgi:hypothetical protein
LTSDGLAAPAAAGASALLLLLLLPPLLPLLSLLLRPLLLLMLLLLLLASRACDNERLRPEDVAPPLERFAPRWELGYAAAIPSCARSLLISCSEERCVSSIERYVRWMGARSDSRFSIHSSLAMSNEIAPLADSNSEFAFSSCRCVRAA